MSDATERQGSDAAQARAGGKELLDCERAARSSGTSSEGRMLGFVREFWAFLRVRKKFWLLPIFLVMALFGVLMVLTQGSAVAPFIYTLF
jgi:hypothetical protein